MRSWFKFAVKIAISLIFFRILLQFVQTEELFTVFERVEYPYLVLSCLVTLIMVVASCAKWKLILDLHAPRQPFLELFKIYLIGYFFSNILPSTVGGDVVRSYYAGKRIEDQSFSAVSVFVERFSGIFVLFLLATVAPLIQPQLYKNPYIGVPALGGAVLATITVWVSISRNPFGLPDRLLLWLLSGMRRVGDRHGWHLLRSTGDWLEKRYEKLKRKASKIRGDLAVAKHAFRHNRTFLLRLIWLTLLFYGLTWVNVYVTYRAFGVHVSFLAICAIVPAIMFVAHIPITLLGNLGYFESVFVLYFLIVGVPGAETLAMGLLLRLKMLGLGGAGLLVYMLYRQTAKLELPKTPEQQDASEEA